MFTKISVLVPTRQRLARLRTLIDSFERTNDGAAEMVFRADDDDLDTVDFLGSYRTVVGPRLDGYRSMPTFFNEMFAAAKGDVLMCGNDDMVFKTVGWPSFVLAAANRYADGLFDLGVTTHNETHYPFSIVSRVAAERLGFLWDPRIFWGDIFLRDVMAAFGRCEMLPSVEIDHDWAGFKPDRVFNEADKSIDALYWTNTHPQAVAEAVKKLGDLHV
jgi:hypothetical protein